jgi:aspartyl-tRNA(Asn)/glutamyl-tRNA(Gln) amidotransferase subunit B
LANYTPIIGLEVHVELKTASKMFCSCPADYFGAEPNSHTCPVCLGLPGALPVTNMQAIDWCLLIAMSLNCDISMFSKFDRKNYFYPDLPKGYQISQYDLPFGKNGHMILKSGKKIGITRVHMEEDTGKLSHVEGESLIDFNRSSVPLVEIVTEPDFHDALEVKEYLQNLQQIVRYLEVSNADMEKGDMRLEPNISLSDIPFSEFPITLNKLPKYKVEVKNINSFKFVEKAINYELTRQEEILESGNIPPQETRGWDEKRGLTFSQRIKEEANDYRYFPEPDIPPFRFTENQISSLRSSVPELPEIKKARFIKLFSLSEYDSEILTRERTTADCFESIVKKAEGTDITPKQIANIIINKKIDLITVSGEEILSMIQKNNSRPTVDEATMQKALEEVIATNEKAVTDYKSGKESVIMYLVGQVMKALQGSGDAKVIKERLEALMKHE